MAASLEAGPDQPSPASPSTLAGAGAASPSTTVALHDRAQDRRGCEHLPGTAAPAEHDPLARHDSTVDPDRQPVRQPEDRHAPDLVTGDGSRLSGDANDAFLVPSSLRTTRLTSRRWVARTTHAPWTRRIGLPGDEDRVRRVLEREAVGGAEHSGVGEGRVAGKELVWSAPGEGALEGFAVRSVAMVTNGTGSGQLPVPARSAGTSQEAAAWIGSIGSTSTATSIGSSWPARSAN